MRLVKKTLFTTIPINLNPNSFPKKTGKKILLNNTNRPINYLFSTPLRLNKESVVVEVRAEGKKAENCKILILSKRMRVVKELRLNQRYFFDTPGNTHFLAIALPAGAELNIQKIIIKKSDEKQAVLDTHFSGDVLVILPEVPVAGSTSEISHTTRLKALEELNLKPILVTASPDDLDTTVLHKIDGRTILKTGYNEIRTALQTKSYSRIISLCFNEKIAQILDATNLLDTYLYLYPSLEDTLYRDLPSLHRPYFKLAEPNSNNVSEAHTVLDDSIQRYDKMPNVQWVFNCKRHKDLSQKLLPLTYEKSEIIHPLIAPSWKETNKEKNVLRVLIAGSFKDLQREGVDTAIRTILELSTHQSFSDTAFTILGDGEMHDVLTEPIRHFTNVTLVPSEITSASLSSELSRHDVLLYPARYIVNPDLLSAAAAAGVVTITSENIGAEEFPWINSESLCKPEEFQEFAKRIDNLVSVKEIATAKKYVRERVSEYLSSKKNPNTLEAAMLRSNASLVFPSIKCGARDEYPVLTIAIPSYHVEKFLINGVTSLVNHPLSHKLEILIINDGSKDDTAKIGKKLEKLCNSGPRPVVRLINKENGGHGSTINTGIREATGKYFRLMDGDDYFVTSEFTKLIEILEHEETDIVLTNYIEDFAVSAIKRPVHLYDFMEPGAVHKLDLMNYHGYGFGQWGPMLPSTTCKTSLLKSADFIIDEHCFYVDMEYNFMIYSKAETVVYYPLDIYNYYLGRAGQSMSKESFKKNYLHHEKVTLRLMHELEARKEQISPNKQEYLINILMVPLTKVQYMVVTEYFDNPEPFLSFDKKLRKYPFFYNHPKVVGKMIRLHRKTQGRLIVADSNIKNLRKFLPKRTT